MGKDPFDVVCAITGTKIELGLCSDVMDAIDGDKCNGRIYDDLVCDEIGHLTPEAVAKCRTCPRWSMIYPR